MTVFLSPIGETPDCPRLLKYIYMQVILLIQETSNDDASVAHRKNQRGKTTCAAAILHWTSTPSFDRLLSPARCCSIVLQLTSSVSASLGSRGETLQQARSRSRGYRLVPSSFVDDCNLPIAPNTAIVDVDIWS